MTNTNRGFRVVLVSLFILLMGSGAPGAVHAQGVAGAAPGQIPILFHTSDQCMACHNQLTAPDGTDVSFGFSWRSSMMGNSARDPYWMAAVRRESVDHPHALEHIQDKCTVCHLPMARTTSVAMGEQPQAFVNFPGLGAGGPFTILAQDGVSCAVCHQIRDENLGTPEGFTGGYVIDFTTPMGQRTAFGPVQVDAGRTRVMHSASELTPRQSSHIQSAAFCANCHTLFTQAVDPQGNEVGELPEQAPYLEWLHSDYPGEKTCQSCHMPVVEGEVPLTGVLPNPRTQVNRHVFKGGNFLMPRILNKHRAQMNVMALPQELDATARASEENLAENTATLEVGRLNLADDVLVAEVTVTNLAGHKLPSAYPSRRAWLHYTVLDAQGGIVFESGAFQPDGMILGNDNDEDGTRFEPHYTEITRADQVQIYEDIMVDYAGEVTTGLLYGARYIKDNRLLPRGFDKATAGAHVAVHGGAAQDPDFSGGSDVVRYSVTVGNARPPLTVVAELWYQPIGFRWAMNLGEYDTEESAQFGRFFEDMASSSGALLARTEMTLR